MNALILQNKGQSLVIIVERLVIWVDSVKNLKKNVVGLVDLVTVAEEDVDLVEAVEVVTVEAVTAQ